MGFFGELEQLRESADGPAPDPRRLLGDLAAHHRQGRHLIANGRVGQATITELHDTGLSVNENPQVHLEVMVTLDGEPPYAAAVTQVICRLAFASFQPGATVPVRVDPANPQALVVA